MKRLGIVLVSLLTLAGAAAAAAPKIAVDGPVYAATVPAGTTASHTFLLRNDGDEALRISNVWTSCGCTTASLAKRELAPGEWVELVASLDTKGYAGLVEKNIQVASNDPSTPTLVLRLAVTVVTKQPYHIEAAEVAKLFYLLVDLRTQEEYDVGHLMGAVSIPYAELAAWMGRLPRDVLIVLYDGTGALSDRAAQDLVKAGFAKARSLLGGLDEWTRVFGQTFVIPF